VDRAQVNRESEVGSVRLCYRRQNTAPDYRFRNTAPDYRLGLPIGTTDPAIAAP